ncbi:protein ORF136A [Cyprinid herpesvirus 1]|uniref:Protein ORF136A n=1 Tax=Cyprinid herpesvirus 1 TaxID=317858 RepID=K7PBM6_9VIRU|nr:protein ORF136A [Cyprinid herpesvirus 1]AFJ20426.1 protein ORF136A [Cyprinid herpesvirus 1]
MHFITIQRLMMLKFFLGLCLLAYATSAAAVETAEDCLSEEYYNKEEKRCCARCTPGSHLIKECSGEEPTICQECDEGTFLETWNYAPNCFRCNRCNKGHHVTVKACTPQSNAECGCADGYTIRTLDGLTTQCRRTGRS